MSHYTTALDILNGITVTSKMVVIISFLTHVLQAVHNTHSIMTVYCYNTKIITGFIHKMNNK
jgi:hypothetical protein